MDLSTLFLEFAEDNLRIAKFLSGQRHHVQSIYQLEQSFEKVIKSYYILVKTNIEHNNEQMVHAKVIKMSHEIEDATLNLLIEAADIDMVRFTRKANSPEYARNPRYIQEYEKLIEGVAGYKARLEDMKSKNLDADFVSNVERYDEFINEKYKQYIKGSRVVKFAAEKGMWEFGAKFNTLLDGLVNLYPCLYKMNDTSQYPLAAFDYMNLEYLNNGNASNNIIMMSNRLLKTYRWLLDNRYLLGE